MLRREYMKYAIRKENQYYQILKDLNLGMTKENKAIYYDLNQIQRVINNMNPVNAQKYDIVAENPTLDQRLNVLMTGSLNSKWYRVMKIMCHDGSNIAEQEKDYKKQLSFYDREIADLLHDMENNHSVIEFFKISWQIRKNRINRRICKNDLMFIQSFEKSVNQSELESAALELKKAESPVYRYRLKDHEELPV